MSIPAQTVREVVGYYASLLEFAQVYLRVPGVQGAVYADGDVVWSGAFGHADVENSVPLTVGHLFRIASHSKTFTATAVLQLVEQGKLRLDDTAAAHLPELAGTPLGDVALRDLLSHSAGLTRDSRDGDFWQLEGEFPDHARLDEVLRDPASVVLAANERFKYSNIGYGLLGLVIEAATGAPYAEYVRKEIVDRLGLADLGPELDPARLGDYAVGYSAVAYAGDATRRVPIEHVDTRALASATGFYGTAADLVTYFSAHLLGDDRLLSDASKRVMQHPVWPVKPGDVEQRYGLGMSVTKIGDRDYVGHGGGYPGHITRTLVDPDRRIVVSVLTNAIDGPALRLAQAFPKLLDLATNEPPVATVAETDLARFTGRYMTLWGITDIALLGGRLYQLDPTLDDPAADAVELEFIDDTTLRMTGDNGYGSYGELMTYTFDADGNVVSLRGNSGNTLRPLDSFELPDRFTIRSR